jgi:hypothetical protein
MWHEQVGEAQGRMGVYVFVCEWHVRWVLWCVVVGVGVGVGVGVCDVCSDLRGSSISLSLSLPLPPSPSLAISLPPTLPPSPIGSRAPTASDEAQIWKRTRCIGPCRHKYKRAHPTNAMGHTPQIQ